MRWKFKAKSGNVSRTGLSDPSHRSLAVSGTRTALVVRIVASNIAPLKSEATLSNAVFGNGADGTVDPMSLKSMYTTCSHGQLTFVQASDRNGRSINIRKGKRDSLSSLVAPTKHLYSGCLTPFLSLFLLTGSICCIHLLNDTHQNRCHDCDSIHPCGRCWGGNQCSHRRAELPIQYHKSSTAG